MKILVIRFSSAGDILCTTPLLRLLRHRWPEAHITYLTRARFSALLERNERIDELLVHPDQTPFTGELRLRRKIRRTGYDLIIDLHASLRSRLITVGLPARLLRHRKDPLRRLRVRTGQVQADLPMPLRHIAMLRPLGIEDDGYGLEMPVGDVRSPLPSDLSDVSGPLIALAPGARHGTKKWPTERFAELAGRLLELPGASLVFVGGPEDCRTAEAIMDGLPKEDRRRVIDLTGRTGWDETARIISDADALVSNDSVAGHIAAGVGTPVVSLFGSTVPEFGFVPFRVPVEVVEVRELECRPCTRTGRATCPLGHFRCMNDITVDQVSAAVRRLLPDGKV